MKQLTREQAEQQGFAGFNRGNHLCIDIPNGNTTITCRTKDGKKLTFAFCPYEEDGLPKCVDIMHHHQGPSVQNGDANLPVQEVIVFGPGNNAFSTVKHMESNPHKTKIPTLTTVLLKN